MDDDALVARVVALCEAKDFAAAHSLIDADQVNVPVEMRLRLHAAVYLVSGKASHAAEMIDHALVYSSSDDAGELARTAQFMLWSRQPAIATSCARRALAIDDEQWRAHLVLAEIALKRNLPAATASARRAVELAPDEAETHLLLARVLFASPRAQREARAEARRAAELDPDDPRVRRLTASRTGRWSRWVALAVTAAILTGLQALIRALEPWSWFVAGVVVATVLGWPFVVAMRDGAGAGAVFSEKRALAHDEFRAASSARWYGDGTSLCLPLGAITWAVLAANLADGGRMPMLAVGLPGLDLVLPLVCGPVLLDWWYGRGATQAMWQSSWILRAQTWTSTALSLTSAALFATGYHGRPVWTSLLIVFFAWNATSLGVIIRLSREQAARRPNRGWRRDAG